MKRIKKVIALGIAVSTMLLTFSGCKMFEKTPEKIASTVLAKVGDKEITRGDVDKLLYSTLQQYKAEYGDNFEENDSVKEQLKSYRQQAVEALVEKEILYKIKEDKKYKIDEDEVKSEVNDTVKQIEESLSDGKTLDDYAKQYGYDSAKELKKEVKENKYLSKVKDKMVEKVTVSEDEVTKYYNDNKSSYEVKAGADVEQLAFTNSDTSEADAKAAKEIMNSDGSTLEDISKMDDYKDKVSYQNLGHVDYDSSSYEEAFLTALKSLQDGQVSDPISLSTGYQIIKASNIVTETYTKTLDEVHDEVKETALQSKQSKKYEKMIKKYKESVGVKTYDDRY